MHNLQKFSVKISRVNDRGKGEVLDKLEIESMSIDKYSSSINPEQEKSLIISDKDFPIHKKIRKRYSNISFLRSIHVYLHEKKIKTYKVYLGKP